MSLSAPSHMAPPVAAPLAPPLLAPDEPPAYGVVNPDGTSPYVLLCEHASPRIPRVLGDLGLKRAEIMRHIGWDIGAQAVALRLAERLDAPLFMTNYSRLVIDCNRPLDNPSLIPAISDGTRIPGNSNLTGAARNARIEALFTPFHAAVSRRLDLRRQAGQRTLVVGVHSFTQRFQGQTRPWSAGVLFDRADSFGNAVIAAFTAAGAANVVPNEPYVIDQNDYTVPVHGNARNLPSALIEMRQDLLSDETGIEKWADYLHRALATVLDREGVDDLDGGTP